MKNEGQLDLQALHRVRDRWIGRKTAVINQLRGFLLEHGITVPAGPAHLNRQVPSILEHAENLLSPRMRTLLLELRDEWVELEEQIDASNRELACLLGQCSDGQLLPHAQSERVHHCIYASKEQARRDLFAYVEGFYNSHRLHSALGYRSPADMERSAALRERQWRGSRGSPSRDMPWTHRSLVYLEAYVIAELRSRFGPVSVGAVFQRISLHAADWGVSVSCKVESIV